MLALLPNTVLAGLLYMLVKREVSRLEHDKVKAEVALEKISAQLVDLDKRLVDTATRPMLGSLGDRLDGRITNVAQELAVVKDRQERPK